MSDIVLVAIIALCGVVITVFGAILPLFINRWFKKIDEKLDKYQKEVNGNMTILLAAKKAEGILEEKENTEAKIGELTDRLVEAAKQIPTENQDTPTEVEVVNKEPIVVKIPNL